MQEDRDDPVVMMRKHFATARRLRAGIKTYPDARAGLEKSAAFHIAQASKIARELCSGSRLQAQTTEDQRRRAIGK